MRTFWIFLTSSLQIWGPGMKWGIRKSLILIRDWCFLGRIKGTTRSTAVSLAACGPPCPRNALSGMIIKRNKNSYSTFCICACLRQVVGAQMKITPRCKISVSSSCFFSDWLWAGSGLMPDHCCDSQAESMHSEFHSCVPCALQSKGTIQACCHVAITVTLQRNTFKFACKAPKGDVVICGVWASGNICKPFFFISFVLDHLKIWKFDQKKSSYELCHQPDLRKFSGNFFLVWWKSRPQRLPDIRE